MALSFDSAKRREVLTVDVETYIKREGDLRMGGGYSKKVVYAYGIILLCGAMLGWIIFPIKLWMALLCFLFSFPLLFLYRYAQCLEEAIGKAVTPSYWWTQSSRFILKATGMFLLVLSIWLSYPFIQSIPLL